jgi:hypothetical protein
MGGLVTTLDGLINILEEYTGKGISSWHPPNLGYRGWKKALQVSICVCDASDWGMVGKPTLQVGGEQAAVMLAAPGEFSVSWQDSVHPVATEIAPG